MKVLRRKCWICGVRGTVQQFENWAGIGDIRVCKNMRACTRRWREQNPDKARRMDEYP